MSEEQNLGAGQETKEVQKQTTSTTKVRRQSKFGKIILKHKLNFSLAFALLFVFIWAQWRINKLEKEKVAIQTTHVAEMDSLKLADYVELGKVFSWAVRDDIMRNNLNLAQIHLNNIVENEYIEKAYIINTTDNSILISSNEGEAGLPLAEALLTEAAEANVIRTGGKTRIVTPISGLNNKIALSVLETTLK